MPAKTETDEEYHSGEGVSKSGLDDLDQDAIPFSVQGSARKSPRSTLARPRTSPSLSQSGLSIQSPRGRRIDAATSGRTSSTHHAP